MIITITCACGTTVEQDYRGGKKRQRCDACAEIHNREKHRQRCARLRKRNKGHKKQAAPLIPYRKFHFDEEDRLPVIPPVERARIAQEAAKERLGMDDAAFSRWMQGKVWTYDSGFLEARR